MVDNEPKKDHMPPKKKDFWNSWDLKTLITILTIIITASFYFAKLEAKIDSNAVLMREEIDHIRENQTLNKENLESKINSLQTDILILRNYITEQSRLK